MCLFINSSQLATVFPEKKTSQFSWIFSYISSTFFSFPLQRHKVDLFYKLRHVMNELIDLRRQILSGHLTQDQVREVKRHITIRLDWGNE